MSDLTPRQTEILRLIQRAINETGMPPTRAEIANELGFKSPNAAEEHLRALARKGVIALVPGASRGIKLMDTMREQMGLPLIGRVAAGRPILAEENIESRLDIDPSIFQPRPHYLLKVVGMSMKDAGILDGDLVAVHRTPEVRNRQIIVARLENEVTVKRYKQEGSVVWLLPENADFEPIKVNIKEDPLIIEGVVVGVLAAGQGSLLNDVRRRFDGVRVGREPLKVHMLLGLRTAIYRMSIHCRGQALVHESAGFPALLRPAVLRGFQCRRLRARVSCPMPRLKLHGTVPTGASKTSNVLRPAARTRRAAA